MFCFVSSSFAACIGVFPPNASAAADCAPASFASSAAVSVVGTVWFGTFGFKLVNTFAVG